MQVSVEKLSPVLVEYQIGIPAGRVQTELDRAYVDLQRTARIKGFRPGKAPRQVLAHLFAGRINADVAQRLVDTTLNEVLSQRQVQPLSRPVIAPAELKPEAAFSYKARFEVRPDIERVAWEGLTVTRPAAAATDDMVDAEVANQRREHATLRAPEPERPAKKGDVVRIALKLESPGLKEAQAEQEMETEVGNGQILAELDDALAGMSAGDKKDVAITFSDRHTNADLRGKPGTFHVIVKDVKEREYPEVDDEFAKDCGHDDLKAMRVDLKTKIEKELKQKADDAVAEQLVVELCKANPIPVPPTLVEQQAEQSERDLALEARKRGQRPDTSAAFRAHLRADSELKVRAGLLMAEIAKEKKIQVTEDDIEKGYGELAEQTGKNVAKVRAEYRDQKKREMLIGMIVEDKILNLVEAAAKVTDAAGPGGASRPAAEKK